jgi:Holliday junction resolvase RusA-like endonuclease
MARISEADARRLGIGPPPKAPSAARKRVADGKAAAPRRKAVKGIPGSGRNREPRVAVEGAAVSIDVELPFDPRPKGRPRTVPNWPVIYAAVAASGGSVSAFKAALARAASEGRPTTTTYTPEGTAEYEKLLKAAAASAMVGRVPFGCAVEVELVTVLAGDPDVWPTSPNDGDSDNHEKAILDALNEIAFVDDRLVVRSTRVKECGPVPKVSVRVRPADPNRRLACSFRAAHPASTSNDEG